MSDFVYKEEGSISISEDAINYYATIFEKAMSNVINQALKDFEMNVLDPKLRDLETNLQQYVRDYEAPIIRA